MDKYRPEKYWENRLNKDFSLGGVGSCGLGKEYNKWLYKARIRTLSELLKKYQINPYKKRILDIGAGTGFYINHWKKLGADFVVGLDITEKSVSTLEKKFPQYKFLKADVSSDELNIEGKFDIITAFDVLFHIVEEKKFEQTIRNIKKMAHENTKILISDIFLKEYCSPHFHENDRTLNRYKEVLEKEGFKCVTIIPIFYLMNNPLDICALKNGFAKIVLPRLWTINKTIISLSINRTGLFGNIIGYLCGIILFILDGFILMQTKDGPSTKLMLVEVR
jgi:SAM-dependent methyltransferase